VGIGFVQPSTIVDRSYVKILLVSPAKTVNTISALTWSPDSIAFVAGFDSIAYLQVLIQIDSFISARLSGHSRSCILFFFFEHVPSKRGCLSLFLLIEAFRSIVRKPTPAALYRWAKLHLLR
jgi:hypothetical protein